MNHTMLDDGFGNIRYDIWDADETTIDRAIYFHLGYWL